MTAFTTPKTWTSGNASSAEFNEQVRDNIKNVDERLTLHGMTSESTVQYVKTARYGVSISLSSAQSCASSSDVKLVYPEADEEWDDAAFHDNVETARLTAPTDGTYDLDLWVSFEQNATGFRQAWLEVNAATSYFRTRMDAATNTSTSFCLGGKIALTAGDYIFAYVRHNSGSALDVSSRIQMHKISE